MFPSTLPLLEKKNPKRRPLVIGWTTMSSKGNIGS